VGIMLAYGTIFGDQRGRVQCGLPDDKAIEGIPSPRLLDDNGNNLLEGLFPNTQSKVLGSVVRPVSYRYCNSSDTIGGIASSLVLSRSRTDQLKRVVRPA